VPRQVPSGAHANGVQSVVVVLAMQSPTPLHVGASTTTLPLQRSEPQETVALGNAQPFGDVPSQLPPHAPLPPHGARPPWGGPAIGLHCPVNVPSQASHSESQGESQQKPSTQKPSVH
jgi:hypothetical protein